MLNGRITEAQQAAVPIDDRAFLYGDSVFTTLRCYGGKPFRLDRHCARLNDSLRSRILAIDYTVDPTRLAADIARLLELNACPDAALRFTISRGSGAGPLPPDSARPTTLLTARSYRPDPARQHGVRLITTTVRRDPAGELGKHKLGSYAPSLLARREAHAAGAYEGVISDTAGNLLECACSNLFAVADGKIITPDVSRNLLPGIARETVFECVTRLAMPGKAGGHGDTPLHASMQDLTPDLIARADEMFITNSLIEVAPVASLDGRSFSAPGPTTEQLMHAYHQKVMKEV